MQIFANPGHEAHAPAVEFSRGRLIPYRESPDRARFVAEALTAAGFSVHASPWPQSAAAAADLEARLQEAGHDPAYLAFLATAWDRWRAEGQGDDVAALPTAWALPGLGPAAAADLSARGWDPAPDAAVEALLGRYAFDSATPIGAGTWAVARAAAACAQTTADRVADQAAAWSGGGAGPAAFALCRPPGHHAAAALMGGYCYLNNAAVAAVTLRARGADKVGILDVDYHHGNGTQALFEDRADVVFASLHADPAWAFPYFSGNAAERGRGPGLGATLNLPLPPGTDDARWFDALAEALGFLERAGIDALVVSLGVDTWAGDPLSRFQVSRAAFPRLGRRLRAVGRPTVVVMEGGYAVAEMGAVVADVLIGLAGG